MSTDFERFCLAVLPEIVDRQDIESLIDHPMSESDALDSIGLLEIVFRYESLGGLWPASGRMGDVTLRQLHQKLVSERNGLLSQSSIERSSPPPGSHPELFGRYTYLRPPNPEDTERLRTIEAIGRHHYESMSGGRSMTSADFSSLYWSDVFYSFVVQAIGGGPIGWVRVRRANMVAGTAFVDGGLYPFAERQGWPMEGFLLAICFTFSAAPFRKLYVEFAEPTLSRIGLKLLDIGTLEVRRRSHYRVGESREDSLIVSLNKVNWNEKVGSRGLRTD